MSEHLVVIGGGQAASQAIQSSRQLGFDGRITLIGEEALPPYQRPPLSKKFLAGELARERLLLKSESFYEDRGVALRLGVKAEELDLATRSVRLGDSSVLAYDYLLLATGALVRRLNVPGTALTGVNYLRTVDDVDAISPHLQPGARIIVVGGGYIGLEVASVCRERGCEVTILEAAERILGRVVCADTAAFFERLHRESGVEIFCDSMVSQFVGNDNGRVTSVLTSDGAEYACDCAIVGIGVEPNLELAKGAGLPCENGIMVDAYTRTSVEHVVAAGDCTAHPHPWVGRRVRLESVHNAIEQGKSAAASLFSEARPFDEVPWFWSDQYGLKLQIVGLALDYDETIVRGDPSTKSFSVCYLRDGRVVALDCVNKPRDFLAGRKLLPRTPRIPREALADEHVDLSSFFASG